jgi:hypothetical protein
LSKKSKKLEHINPGARGIAAEPPKGMSEAKCPKVMERIARREARKARRSGSPKKNCASYNFKYFIFHIFSA